MPTTENDDVVTLLTQKKVVRLMSCKKVSKYFFLSVCDSLHFGERVSGDNSLTMYHAIWAITGRISRNCYILEADLT